MSLSGLTSLAGGGTNNPNLIAVAGGVVYTDSTMMKVTAAGTSGYFLQSTGTGTPVWAAVSSGASTTLNNLDTTAMNANLIFDQVGTSILKTKDVDSTSSGLLIVQSGNTTTSGASGAVTLTSGNTQISNTGAITVSSGSTTTGASSGTISILTGTGPAATGAISITTSTAGTNSGAITIQSGSAPTGTSGSLTLGPGTGSTRGNILLVDGTEGTAGYVWTSTDTTGKGSWLATNRATYVSTQFDKTTSTALANITGLTANVVASGVYKFKAVLFVNSAVTGGQKYSIAGTATATSIIFQILTLANQGNTYNINEQLTSLGSSGGEASNNGLNYTEITGTIVVNAAGTLTVQFAQNASSGTSSVLVGSTFEVSRVA
jgi:hypothetical protein